jgi:DNA-binding LacI/PurR family transcriptional regulator
MPLTIKDVAKRSNVSTATVSRALRGLPNVAPSTREHVIKVAKEMGYSIDPIASQLRSGRTKNVGIVMPLTDSWFYSKLSTASEAILINAGFYAIRYSMTNTEGQTAFFERLINRKNIDGLIISTLTLSEADIHILSNANIPIITIESQTEAFSSIGIDNLTAAKVATRYLLNLGHRQIGVISGLEDDPMNFSVPKKRLLGYRSALEEYQVEYRPELIVPGNYSFVGGSEAAVQLLSIASPPTAIFALSDEMAIGAIKTLHEMNLRIPEDVSVLGFDDNDMSDYVGLSTVRQPVMEYGERAATFLLDQLGKNENRPHHIKMSSQLIIRGSTGPKLSTPLDMAREQSDI